MGNSISRFFRCFSVPANIVPTHAPPTRASLSCVPLHTVYPYLTGLLLALIEIKYQGLSSNLSKEHPVMIMLFLISKFVNVIALVTFPSDQTNYHSLDLKVVVCHVSGTIGCELLLLLLVSPIQCFIINVSTLTLVLAIFLSCRYLLKLLNHVPTLEATETRNAEEQSDETINEGQTAEVTSTP